jgi:ComF family protein
MTSSILHWFRQFLDSFLDFVYPPLCISCGRLLETSREHVCPECWSAITPVTRDLDLFLETRNKLLASGTIDELVSLFVFEKEGPFQKIAHALKYSGIQGIGIELGRRIGSVASRGEIRADLIVPVPLHKRKIRERGYNQSLLIARGVSEVTGIPVKADLVHRRRWTETQTALSKEERKKNVDDAFTCENRELNGACVIVIDDVITTGATIEAVAAALKSSGAEVVVAASAALAK